MKIVCLHIILLFFIVFILPASGNDQLTNNSKALVPHDTSYVTKLNERSKHFMYDNTDSALWYAEKAVELAEKLNFTKGKAWALNNLGVALYINGSYDRALKAYVDSKALFNNIGNKNRVAWARNNMALIYIAQERYDLAIKEYQSMLSDAVADDDHYFYGTVLFNLGLSYDSRGEYDKAIAVLQKALHVSKQYNLNNLKALSNNRLGEVYFNKKEFKTAKAYYNKVATDTANQHNWEYAFAHAGLAQVYCSLGEYKKAIIHGEISLEYASKVKAKWDVARVLKILATANAAANNYEDAYEYHTLYKKYSDSLYSEAKEKEINYLNLKQEEAENIQLAKQNELNLHKIWLNRLFLIIIGVLALFFLMLFFIYFRNNRHKSRLNKLLIKTNLEIADKNNLILKQKKALEETNSTKDQLFSIISHDLKSPLASITGTLDIIRKGALTEDEQQRIFKDLHLKVILVSQMLNNLLQWSNSQQLGIRIKPDKVQITELTANVLPIAQFIAREKNVSIHHYPQPDLYVKVDENHIKIVLQNLIGNAIKFTPAGGRIDIFYTENDEYQIIHIKDTGIGMPDDKLKQLFLITGNEISETGTNSEGGTGIGLMLVQQFVKENGGKIEVDSEAGEGTEVKVSFRKFLEDKMESSVEQSVQYRSSIC